MIKKLYFTGFNKRNAPLRKVLLWVLLLFPVFSFAIESFYPEKQNTSQEPVQPAVIYMSSGSVMVGMEQIHNVKIIALDSSPEVILEDLVEKAISKETSNFKKNKKLPTENIDKTVSTKIIPNETILFSEIPVGNSSFAAKKSSCNLAIVPSNNFHKKSLLKNSEVFFYYTISYLQKNFFSYKFLPITAVLNCKIHSLRAPPQVFI